MTSAICTLFEGDYHYGVGALANSLYAQGFRGTIYIGYRGSLPPWIGIVTANCKPTEYTPVEGLTLQFILVTTEVHLASYKPDFMLRLWEEQCPDADALFYFDPDIVVLCHWNFFREWVTAGLAICADINASMPSNHPTRFRWKQLCAKHGLTVRRELEAYFNAGFLGVRRDQMNFLRNWQHALEIARSIVGGLNQLKIRDENFLFFTPDQDAMNIACMLSEDEISPIGQDGMDFQYGGGGRVMAHATGVIKPWHKIMLVETVVKGRSPSRADKAFYSSVRCPIRVFSSGSFLSRKVDLTLASAVGRYIK
jgi:hypothetical protein